MAKIMRIILLAFISSLLLSGCSTTYTVNTYPVEKLRSDLENVTSSISKVDVSFTKPTLFINVYFTDNPAKETIDTVLEMVKSFTTEDTIKEISPTVDSGIAMRVGLYIYTEYADNSSKPAAYTYSTDYSKTGYITDDLQNVIHFKVWSEGPP